MPKYRVTLSDGRVVTLEADQQPSEQDVLSAIGATGAQPPAATPTPATAPSRRDILAAMDPAAIWAQEKQQKRDVGTGMAKGAANTAFGLGKAVRDYTPLGRVSDAIQPGAFDRRPDYTQPTNADQQLGHTVEQVGEFFVGGGLPGKVGKLATAAKDAGLAYVQSGSPTQAGLTGVVSAVLPGGATARRAAGTLERSAQSTMAQALGATKEWAKDEAAKLAPEMLKRGIGGSIHTMRALARNTAAKVGQNLDDAYKTAAAAGETVSSDIVRGNIQLAAETLHVATPTGGRIPVPGYEAAIGQLTKLDGFIEKLGADIPVDKAAFVKRAWDDIVSASGLYGQKATASASEKAMAWSFREAANSFRSMLNTNPTIAALNQEAGFWIGLRDVLDATKLRKVAQSGGLVKAGASTVGAGVGAMTGDSPLDMAKNGLIGGLAGQQFVKLVQSPAFRSKVSAPLKQALADALASGSTARITSVVGRITASLPAQFRPAVTTP